ncbi:MAG: hypothetical protein M5U28_11020 [Sandaracinaceae bacterium]|nr:hypothetical protein [Sandaracinaceae bacterium]
MEELGPDIWTVPQPLVKARRDGILAWHFDRVSVCHRELVERGREDVFARATAWLG